jgi:hypothetical protein
MQKLEIFQSLWAMEIRQPGVAERNMAENFQMIADAGYDGISIDPSVAEIPTYAEVGSLCKRHNLGCMVNAFPYALDDMQPILEFAKELDACMVNVIGGVMPINASDAVPIIQRWRDDADRIGVPLIFETHRDSLLNDLFYTLQVLDAVPDLRLCADLSHFVVDREMRLPLRSSDVAYIQRILEHSDSFQGRVANREQVQVQIGFLQHQEWVDTFKSWWKTGMRLWRARNAGDATLHFLCELGPPPYAITDGEQKELSDRWEEALQIRQWVLEMWNELEIEEQSN